METLLAPLSLTTILSSMSKQTPKGGFKLPSSKGFDVDAILVEHLNAVVVTISHQNIVF